MISIRSQRQSRTIAGDRTGDILRTVNMTVAYGQSVVVQDINLEVVPGQVVALMGRNGAGKTTLLKSVIGALPIRRGHLYYEGNDISRWPSYRRARSGIGYVPQGRGIFPLLSVYENLMVGLEPVGGRDDGDIERIYALFPVLKQMSRRTAGLLSGGQQQQLAVGRALISRPRLLLLDEPTEGIQPSIVEEIERVIASLRGTMSILLVEQFLDFALSVADQCYVMETGSIVLHGAPDSIDLDALRTYLAV
ncbi:MAG: urea ABC transporter ATP-binding subunit UrtE [Dehalococcoidia bacterium]